MRQEEGNKQIVGRWFTNFWGKTVDLSIVDQLAATAADQTRLR